MVSQQKLPPPSLALQDVLCLLRWPWSEPGHWCQPLNSTSHGHTPLGEGKQETQRDRQRNRNRHRENETDMETGTKGGVYTLKPKKKKGTETQNSMVRGNRRGRPEDAEGDSVVQLFGEESHLFLYEFNHNN